MTDEPKDWRKKNGDYAFKQRVEFDPEEAFAIYLRLTAPSVKAVHRELVAAGVSVGEATVRRWSHKFDWAERRERAEAGKRAFALPSTEDLAKLLRVEAQWLDAAYLKGLQHRIASTMAQQIGQLELTTPDDYMRMVEVVERMDRIIHYHRGEGVGAPAKGSNGKALDPLALDEFKAWRPEDAKGN